MSTGGNKIYCKLYRVTVFAQIAVIYRLMDSQPAAGQPCSLSCVCEVTVTAPVVALATYSAGAVATSRYDSYHSVELATHIARGHRLCVVGRRCSWSTSRPAAKSRFTV